MPAAKRKPARAKTAKPAKRAKRAKRKVRNENAVCRGECRIRTKGMKVGDVRRRVTTDGKKLKIRRVA